MADARRAGGRAPPGAGVERWALVLNAAGRPAGASRPGWTACSSWSACPTRTAVHNAGRTHRRRRSTSWTTIVAALPDGVAGRGHAGHRVRLPVRPARSPPGVVLAAAERGARRRASPGSRSPTPSAPRSRPRSPRLVAATRRLAGDRPGRRAPPRHPRARRRQRPRRRSTPAPTASTAPSAGSAAARSRRAPAATSRWRTSCTCSRSPASTPASTSTR